MRLVANKIAILGDLHGGWTRDDNSFFDRSDYDLLLFVGDLGSGTRRNGLQIIRQLARLRVAALVLPGNNDAEHLAHLSAEFSHQSGKLDILRMFGGTSRKAVEPCGYSLHQLETQAGPLSLIASRPCSRGGPVLSYPEQLGRNYGVMTMDQSVRRLKGLVDEAPDRDLIFLAHNGPHGLGENAADMWGRDFPIADTVTNRPGDWGDEDLSVAIAYARGRGKRVRAVIAGHMHRGAAGKLRPLLRCIDGTLYINAAVVPRITGGKLGPVHHHVEMQTYADPALPEAASGADFEATSYRGLRIVERFRELEDG